MQLRLQWCYKMLTLQLKAGDVVYILKQRIAFFTHSDWLLKLRIASAIHLRGTLAKNVIADGNEFRLLYAIVKIAITTARIILHLISYPQLTYDLFHMHHSLTYLSREHMNSQLTCSQRQWLHSSVGRSVAPVSRGHGFKPR